MTTQSELTADLTILEAMARELESYIIDNQVYRTMMINTGAGNQQFQMSGGDLLARVDALKAAQAELGSQDKVRLEGAIAVVDKTKYELRSRFHDLLRRELKSRQGTLEWAADSRGDDEGEAATPAERQTRRRIAAIRKELGAGASTPAAKPVDELDALEEQLRQALDGLKGLSD